MSAVLQVACPKCSAPAGAACLRKNGADRKSSHRERWKLAGLKLRATQRRGGPRARDQRRHELGWVYFIGAGEGDATRVKVGFTMGNPRKRLRDLQTGSAFPLFLIGYVPGTMRQEKELHGILDQWRVVGEWFAYSGECKEAVLAVIEAHE